MLLKRTFQNHPGLKDDLYKLKNNPYLKLQDIGNKYNLSRERIRQIYNQFFNTSYGQHKIKVEDDLSCPMDPRNKIHIVNKNNYPWLYNKTDTEMKFINICKDKKFKIDPPTNKYTSIVINNLNVKILISCNNLLIPYKTNQKYYRYVIYKKSIKQNDILVLYRDDLNKFVIMKNRIRGNKNSACFYMSKEKSDYRTSKNIYWDKINNYEIFTKNTQK